MHIRKHFEDAVGNACAMMLPIRNEFYIGSGKDLAICALSSVGLLEEISRSHVMNKVVIAGRLLSENKGIDMMIKFVLEHPDLKRIIVCGKEVKGHRAGQALIALIQNGIDSSGRIIGALGPNPILKSPVKDVDAFRRQVEISDMMGTVEIDKLVT
jgi:tetrahydromethanopterin S-methyltransferase subunit A